MANEVHGLGAATAKSAQAARETRDSYGRAVVALWSPTEEASPLARDFEPELEAEDFDARS